MTGGDLGHFSLVEKIGEGGMGQVYKARDRRLDRFVAIKLLAEGRTPNISQRQRRRHSGSAGRGEATGLYLILSLLPLVNPRVSPGGSPRMDAQRTFCLSWGRPRHRLLLRGRQF